MSQVQRHKRVRLLVKRLNRERKQQASKIDILCHDLIAAQREFLRKLNAMSFAARFYKDLLGTADLQSLLRCAGRLIREEMPRAEVTFFLRRPDGCERHMVEGNRDLNLAILRLHDGFTPELLENVCKSNRICIADDLFGMGLAGNPSELATLSVATVPLTDLGRCLGFVLICRTGPEELPTEELEKLGLVTCGLSRAIRAGGVLLPAQS